MANILKTTEEYNNNIFVKLNDLKLGDCKVYLNVFRKNNIGSIYDTITSSLTEYESRKISNIMQDIDISPKTNKLEFKREIRERGNFIEDDLYALYKGFYCLRDSYIGSNSKRKYVTLHEINLVRNYIQLVYLYEKSGILYNEKEVRSRYTDFEYDFLLVELMTSLCLDIITDNEMSILIELLKRDPIMRKDIENIEKMIKFDSGIIMAPPTVHSYEVRLVNPTLDEVLRVQMCMYLTPVLHQITHIARKLKGINIKSVTDFRMIFELENEYDGTEINLTTVNEKNERLRILINSYDISGLLDNFKTAL